MPHCAGPGADDPFDPFDVMDVLERVVRPVVHNLVRSGDLQRVDVGWGPRESIYGSQGAASPPDSPSDGRLIVSDAAERRLHQQFDDELWVLVRVSGHTWHSQIWDIESAQMTTTLADAAYSLADRLEDWLCESVYWGEQVVANVVIPPRNISQ